MVVSILLHATQITDHISSYLYTELHKQVVHLLSLHQDECKQQHCNGNDNIVSVFTSKVQHLENIIHPRCVHLSSSCSPTLSAWKHGLPVERHSLI